MSKIESEKIGCLHRPCSRLAPRGKIELVSRPVKPWLGVWAIHLDAESTVFMTAARQCGARGHICTNVRCSQSQQIEERSRMRENMTRSGRYGYKTPATNVVQGLLEQEDIECVGDCFNSHASFACCSPHQLSSTGSRITSPIALYWQHV